MAQSCHSDKVPLTSNPGAVVCVCFCFPSLKCVTCYNAFQLAEFLLLFAAVFWSETSSTERWRERMFPPQVHHVIYVKPQDEVCSFTVDPVCAFFHFFIFVHVHQVKIITPPKCVYFLERILKTTFSLFLRMLSCCQETNHHSATWRRLCSHWRSWKKSRVSFTAKTHGSQGAPSVILYLSFWRWMLKLIKIDLLSTLPPTVREMKPERHRHTVGSFEQESLQMWCIFCYLPCFFLLISSSLIEPPEWQLLLERCRHLLASVAQEVPEENVYKLKMTDMALDASIELGHWEEALQHGQKTLPAYRYRECGCVCVCLFP